MLSFVAKIKIEELEPSEYRDGLLKAIGVSLHRGLSKSMKLNLVDYYLVTYRKK